MNLSSMKDNTYKPCESCGKGVYREASVMDDWNGHLHCDVCGHQVDRWSRNKMKIGEFVFYEFELCQIKKMDGNKITAVCSVNFETSGFDLSELCRPLTLRTKIISDNFAYYNKKFHENEYKAILNYSDIYQWLVNKWIAACDTDNETALNKKLEEVKEFYNETIKLCESTKSICVKGVRVLGR